MNWVYVACLHVYRIIREGICIHMKYLQKYRTQICNKDITALERKCAGKYYKEENLYQSETYLLEITQCLINNGFSHKNMYTYHIRSLKLENFRFEPAVQCYHQKLTLLCFFSAFYQTSLLYNTRWLLYPCFEGRRNNEVLPFFFWTVNKM